MPTVPVTEGPQVREAPLPGVRVPTDAPAEAFGGGRSADTLADAIGGLGQHVFKLADDEKKKADQVAVQTADRMASELETKLQVDASKMRGKDALGAPDYVTKNWQDQIQKIQDGLTNDDQRSSFSGHANSRWESLNKTTQLHVASQVDELDKSETKAYVASSRALAVLNPFDDARVEHEVARQVAVTQDFAKRQGLTGTETEKALLMDTQSGTYRDVIQARIDAGQTDKAQELFQQAREKMNEGDQVHVAAALKAGQILSQASKVYGAVKDMKLSDGTPDEAKMRATVFSMENLGPVEKEKVWEYVKARAGEDHANGAKQDKANDRNFMNQIIQEKQQGGSLTDALRLAQKSGKDPYEASIYEEAARKLYANADVKSDPSTRINTWEAVKKGGSSKQQIDDLWKNNLLSTADWTSLRELYFNVQSGEVQDPRVKDAWERVKDMADANFKTDKVAKDNYFWALHSQYGNTNAKPEEIIKAAKDSLELDQSTRKHFWFTDVPIPFTGEKKFQTDTKKLESESLAWGQTYEDLGADAGAALRDSLTSMKKGADATPADVESFAQKYGGYDKIKAGTPVNNAIRSLIRGKQKVSPANIDYVLQHGKDGNM